MTEVLSFSYPPELKHQEDVLGSQIKNPRKGIFSFYNRKITVLYFYLMKSLFISSFFLIFLFSISHYIFEPTYLYYEISWLDIPMHILGGLGVGFLINSICKLNGNKISFKNQFLAFILVAISWEIYEYARGVMVYDGLFKYLDTVKDILMGSFGFYISYKSNK